MGYWSELRGWLFKDPAKIIRYLVLFVCCIVVIVQLYECFSKLSNPPISTHSYYILNETIEMPAVTICRDPPYKADVLKNITGSSCTHPRYATCWISYPYGEVDFDEFFNNATYNETETFNQYGLQMLPEHVEITSSIHFNLGRCHTLRPRIELKRATKSDGYSMILRHHINKTNNMNIKYENEPGWHIFIHDMRENFTEINMKGSGRVEYVFAEINEEIEIKLQHQFFSNIASKQQACSTAPGYSDLKCGEICIWKDLSYTANCSGPWMHDVPEESCSSYKTMKNLISDYQKVYEKEKEIDCDCVLPCESRIFPTYIQNRKSFYQPEPDTQVWIYFTTKLVSMMEERPSYDTTQFIADIGGSLGFLLGLSVLGLIGILEHLTLFFCGRVIKRVQLKHEKHVTDQSSQKSEATTVDISTIAEMARGKLPI